MILSRYLSREVYTTLLAVTFVLLLIFLSQQLIRFLSYAAVGKVAANMLFQLLGFEIPYLLSLLLPLGLYLGIILTYGRLHAENEMSVMQSCGLSSMRLIWITSKFTLLITLMVFILMVWINPIISGKKNILLSQVLSIENVLNTLMPGRFQVTPDGKRVVYVEKISRDHKSADNIFIADQMKTPEAENIPTEWAIVSAAKGYQLQQPHTKTKQPYLVAANGSRYEGIPGQNDYKIFQFQTYAVQVPTPVDSLKKDVESQSSLQLLKNYHDPDSAAELQWRLSIPLSALLLCFLALPLSDIKPRQGKYSQVLPAILIYVVYVNLLFVARNWVEQKTIPVSIGIWWVHGVFLGMVFLYLLMRSTNFSKLFGWKTRP